MPEDVEMNDSQPQPQSAAAAVSSSSDALAPAPAPSTLHHLKEIAAVIEAGSLSKEVRRISRAVRLTIALRRRLAARDVAAFLAFALPPSSDAFARLSALVPKIWKTCKSKDSTIPCWLYLAWLLSYSFYGDAVA